MAFGPRLSYALAIVGVVIAAWYALLTPDILRDVLPASVASPFLYTFDTDGVLNEAGRISESSSPYWWLNSGGRMVIEGGVGATMTGDASLFDRWRLAYRMNNEVDTDGGLHPQNLFRLVSRSAWNDIRLESRFKVLNNNWSSSPNRNESNGLFLMSRYIDGETLYYAGVRVDGHAVIKKKYRGTYYTLAEREVFDGEYNLYDRTSLLPHGVWIALRSETITNANGSVSLALFMRDEDGSWKILVSANDSGQMGNPPIRDEGYVGIRTDFMDVAFDSFRIEAM